MFQVYSDFLEEIRKKDKERLKIHKAYQELYSDHFAILYETNRGFPDIL